jgi:glutamate N-acetyltransferase/amino-acid N-acetyltransferase
MDKIHPVSGVRLGTSCAGIKQTEKDDLAIIEIVEGATVATVFTQNKFCAAPVVIAKSHINEAAPQYLLINSGNANAGLGTAGLMAAEQCCDALATATHVKANKVLPFSTGVIGEPLAAEKIVAAIPNALKDLKSEHWAKAALAILTTDTREKVCSRKVKVNGAFVTLTGIAKGSGMIRPDMATMLAYIATDITVDKDLLQSSLKQAVETSFNSITVDGDTSTNDAVVLIATGAQTDLSIRDKNDAGYAEFLAGLIEVCQSLAEQIIRDGEGATKFIRVKVESAISLEEAKEVAYTVAHSPLVKTAFFACDPNWGRILAAVGRANIPQLDVNKVHIYLDDVCIVRDGKRAQEYTESAGQDVLNKDEIAVRICLQQGNSHAEVQTCDLSYDYVKINAEYRT